MKLVASGLKLIKRALIMSAGIFGGFVFGILLCCIPLHLKIKYQIELPLVLIAGILTMIAVLAGALKPKHFMHYFLCPLSWFLSDPDAPDSGSGDSGSELNIEFFYHASYFIGLPLIAVGTFFSLSALLIAGALGVIIFTFGIIQENTGEKEAN